MPSTADQALARELCERLGAHHAARRLRMSRLALVTLAAGLPVFIDTVTAFRARARQVAA